MRHNRIDRVVAAPRLDQCHCAFAVPPRNKLLVRGSISPPPWSKSLLCFRVVWPMHLIWNYPNTALPLKQSLVAFTRPSPKQLFPHGSAYRCAPLGQTYGQMQNYRPTPLKCCLSVVNLVGCVGESNALSLFSLSSLPLQRDLAQQQYRYHQNVPSHGVRWLDVCLPDIYPGQQYLRTDCHRSWK